jgi:DNA polymerase III subunit chi
MSETMSKKAAFYLLPDANPKARDLYACRVVEKAYNTGRKIYIYTASPEQSQTIDTQLWTFRDISFIPHEISSNPNSRLFNLAPPPVLIDNAPPLPDYTDVLINLTATLPSFCKQFAHVVEIIPNEPSWRDLVKKHGEFFAEQGYKVETHEI